MMAVARIQPCATSDGMVGLVSVDRLTSRDSASRISVTFDKDTESVICAVLDRVSLAWQRSNLGDNISCTIGTELNTRRNSLNALRLVLAVSVIVSHTWPIGGYGDDPGFGDQDLGDWAVAGFFAISGYLITMSRVKPAPLIDFFWRRVMRIYPAFIVCLLMVAFVFAPLAASLPGGGTYSPTEGAGYVLRNSALYISQFGIPGTLPDANFPESWNGALWTLFYEFMCYIGIGLLVTMTPKKLLPAAVTLIFFALHRSHLFTSLHGRRRTG